MPGEPSDTTLPKWHSTMDSDMDESKEHSACRCEKQLCEAEYLAALRALQVSETLQAELRYEVARKRLMNAEQRLHVAEQEFFVQL